MSKNLVIYYSRKGQNYVNGTIKSLEKGNTQVAVEYIQEVLDTDVFEVETVKAYASDYTECINEAKAELNQQKRPELVKELSSIDEYDNIFVCGPCWWGTYPMAMFTQLEKLNWENKVVLPLMTHEGSGMGHSEADLKKCCKGADVRKGLPIHGVSVTKAKAEIQAWISKNIEDVK